ncbi:hypothetical protein [Halarchaeum sp. P4]|uniref:hypothetical protein n=1 Tax=Halarchaeum sp. P4 TaxID=3421639 RepID=UPI003EB88A7C
MTFDRRTFLRGLGAATASSLALTSTVSAKGKNGPKKRGFPPSGITEWGGSQKIGNGEVSTFATVTPSGNPKQVGVHFSEGALDALPYAEDFENGNVDNAMKSHGVWMKPFTLDLPDVVPEPFEYVGAGWNPQGHTPKGVYTKPHFDIHFYFNDRETIGDIGINPDTGKPYVISTDDIEKGQVPEGYVLLEGGAVVPNMGAHLAPADAPELDSGKNPDGASDWLHTLIWGAADVDDDDAYELNYVEPMITVDYLQNHLEGVQRQSIAQPDAYPQDGYYPTSYVTRNLGDDGWAVVVADFEKQEA